MYRLLQGDVGSGKTIVAFLSILHVVEHGFQGALMAPTEILAYIVKFFNFSFWLTPNLCSSSTITKHKFLNKILSDNILLMIWKNL